ncbi:hypothetical protein EJ066_25990 [Mesorhizobium sp. M9A.F.Ca.ET.002.03.1.2]|uniref:hypothetical protein n=1 Tax=Mesorhizobium sp. M9A.F.Ca.ET.002.03.1.2 TaxID=2493668 RepID=UPI000F752E7A|nr:hypothetical protein [Mesorhizobium sp. M9A.F.Ca.ET.002.03.1.2]AZO00297.1 hypothetical protein EJ066_25990 [Mesorhizobium sp. M9A.F.Ca.ET.002.03.1.2]
MTVRQRLLAILITGIGGTAAAAASFAMAVYDAANPEGVAVVAAGEPVDTGRWIVTIREARAGPTPPTGIEPLEPKTFVMVEFDADNRSAETSNVLARLLAIDPPIPDLPDPVVYLARDGWVAGGINPGVPERMIAAWEWPPALPPPRTLRLLIGSQIYKRRDNLYGASGWFDRDPVAAVELSVSPAKAEAAR